MVVERIAIAAPKENPVVHGTKALTNFAIQTAFPTIFTYNPEVTREVKGPRIRRVLTRSRDTAVVGEAAGATIALTGNPTLGGIVYAGSRAVGLISEAVAKHRVKKGK